MNEYKQVILNIINNAKDVLIEKNIDNPWIKIYAIEDNNYIVLYIEDNGGGILVEPKTKYLNHILQQKEDGHGTGIGLYMSKVIVEKNMKGKLRVKNINNGALFAIHTPKIFK